MQDSQRQPVPLGLGRQPTPRRHATRKLCVLPASNADPPQSLREKEALTRRRFLVGPAPPSQNSTVRRCPSLRGTKTSSCSCGTELTTLTTSFVGSDLPPQPSLKKNSELECRRSAGHLARHSLWHFHQLNHHLWQKRILHQVASFPHVSKRRVSACCSRVSKAPPTPTRNPRPQSPVSFHAPAFIPSEPFRPTTTTRSYGDQPSTMEPVPAMQDFPLRFRTRFKILF